MKSKFNCPSCGHKLAVELRPATDKPAYRVPNPYRIVFCENVRCASDVAQKEGGSGPSEEAAYQSLLFAVDQETENQCDPFEKEDRDKWAIAEHKNDLEKSGGA